MEHKTFFYDNRLLNMSLMSYDDICKTLGNPIIMIHNELINEHIHYYSYRDRFEIKFFYRAYYIGSVLLSVAYNDDYFKKRHKDICSDLNKGHLPDIYNNVVVKMSIKDVLSDQPESEFDETHDNDIKEESNEIYQNELSEDIQQLLKSIQPTTGNTDEKPKSNINISSDIPENTDSSPVLKFRCASNNMKNKIWNMLSAEYKMDLIKNCIVIDALERYPI